MPDVLAAAILQIAVPIFIGHLLLLDFLKWRSTRDRLVLAITTSALFTVCLEFLVPSWRKSWWLFDTSLLTYIFTASILVAPAVSVWEAGVLQLFGWKYSEAFDVTVRINRLIPIALWIVLPVNAILNNDFAVFVLLAVLVGSIIQWAGLLAHSKNGSGEALLQGLTIKLATYIVFAILMDPIFGGYWPTVNPYHSSPMLLTSFFAISLFLSLIGWSTIATSTRKALEICIASSLILAGLEFLGYTPCCLIDNEKHLSLATQLGVPRASPVGDITSFSSILVIFAAVAIYAFVSFSLEKKLVARARFVPSIVCASVIALSVQFFFATQFNGLSLILLALIVPPCAMAMVLRQRILVGESALRFGNYSFAQSSLESSLNLLERYSKYKSELSLRCYVGLADATARQNLFLQASGFVEKALDTIACGIRPRDEDAFALQRLCEQLHRKTGLSKVNVLKERLEKLVSDFPALTENTQQPATDYALGTMSSGVTRSKALSGSPPGNATWRSTASESAFSDDNPPMPQWTAGSSGGIFGGLFSKRTLARSSGCSIASGGIPGSTPTEALTDRSLQAVPPRIADLVAVAPIWDKTVKARVATSAPPAELPGFAISSAPTFQAGSNFAVQDCNNFTAPKESNCARAEQPGAARPPSAEPWMLPAPDPNVVSLPLTAEWMQVSLEEELTDARQKNGTVSFSLGDNSSVSASEYCSPIEPSASLFRLPSFHKKRDRFDDSSGSVFFSWKIWTIKILILVCCPLLLAVSTGLNYLASQNKDLAEACMSTALTIKQVVLGARNSDTGYAHQALGEYYLEHGKDELAYLNLRSALSIFDENNPLSDEPRQRASWSEEEIEKHNEIRRKVAQLAEGFGDYDGAVMMWQDIETELLRAQREILRFRPGRFNRSSDEVKWVAHSYANDLFRAETQAARLRGVQQQRGEACKLYAAAFARRWSIQDNYFIPTKYSIDWSRGVDSHDFYLEAARAAMNYSMVRDAMGNKDKSFIARRMAHLFATRYLQERILARINQSKEMVTSCNTAHDTKLAVSVFADGQLSNLRVQSSVGPSCCDHKCLMAIQNGFALNENQRLGLSIPVELVCPIDIEFGFRNRANSFGYGAHRKDDGFTAYIP